ncbi:MAG: polysaccharide biosynthesis C-terminal domain-containing protein [Flavobacteriaceae bacterium]|nr:polysaccharide biosynthesis C-terminal domain-containing protein [Flavobacteriaceae bacterium]
MGLLTSFINNFIQRAGNYVLFATIAARLLSFLASWLALQLIDNKELGVVIFAFNIISFFVPIAGLGLHQSLMRYGALLKTELEKNNLFIYTLKKGIIASLLLVALIIAGSYLIEFSFKETQSYLILLSFLIIPMYIFELVKIQFRLKHNNKSFAYAELVYNVLLVLTVFAFSYFYKEKGYAIALLITPFLTSLLFLRKLKIKTTSYKKVAITNFSFYKYGFFASLSNVVTQLLFVIDIFLIGYLLQDSEMVTNYKYVSLIPFSILFLPRVFIATDFVSFTERIYDKNYIRNYIKGYMRLFLFISLFIVLLVYFFSEYILLVFGDEFIRYSDTFLILIAGICGILIFRGLFGNLLSSIGKAHVNYYIASSALLLNLASNYYLIPRYGIKGAAITSAILMWFTGFISYIWFHYLYKKLWLEPS